jgi:hypothetical protein
MRDIKIGAGPLVIRPSSQQEKDFHCLVHQIEILVVDKFRWDDYRLVNKFTDNALGRPLFYTLELLTREISAKNIKVR